MNKKNVVSTILYSLSIVCFFGYLITKESGLMVSGGLLMIGGAMAIIISKKRK